MEQTNQMAELIPAVLTAVGEVTGATVEAILGRTRFQQTNYARQMTIEVLANEYGVTYKAIAQLLRRSLATIYHHRDIMKQQLPIYNAMRNDRRRITELVERKLQNNQTEKQ